MDMNKTYMGCCLLISLMAIIVHVKNNKDNQPILGKIHLRHSIIFIAAFVIVFFQCDIDYVLGIIDKSETNTWVDTTVVAKTLCLSTIAFVSMLLGYRVYSKKIIVPNYTSNAYVFSFKNKNLLCFLGYILLTFYLITVDKRFLLGGYAEGVERGSVNVIIVMLQAVLLAMMAMYSMEFKSRQFSAADFYKKLKWPLLLFLLYIGTVLISGRRTEAIRMSSLLVISYVYCKGLNTNYKRIALIAISFILIFSLAGVLRGGEYGNVRDGFNVLSNYNSISPFTKELAGSVKTLHVAVSYVPSVLDFNYGSTFFPTFFLLVPGLDAFYHRYFIGAEGLANSGDVITNLYFGGDAPYGLGSSIVADVYISFGLLGILVVFLLLGMFIRFLEVKTFCSTNSPYFLALSFGFYSQIMYACRTNVSVLFLSLTYALILIFIFTKRSAYAK